ncbi:MAG: hypothetical protein QME41_02250 [Actinomycetota bacterium]|nr:hypothetical protein [Actinomycetota bacterium]
MNIDKVSNKKVIAVFIVLAALLLALLVVQRMLNETNQISGVSQTTSTSTLNTVGSMTGGSMQEGLKRVAVEVGTIEEAKKIVPYDFPVPTNSSGYELTGIYVEDSSTVYLRYEKSIYMIYHALRAGYDPNIDDTETLSTEPELSRIEVRGYRGIAREPEKDVRDGVARRTDGMITWYENGLDIAIYGDGYHVNQLMRLANSMK